VIADPFVDGGIEIDSSCAFLLMMSDGLYQSLQDATGKDSVNGEIATMVAQEFSQQTTLTGVAQAVVDRVVRIHHDTFMTGTEEQKNLCKKRDDITLLVRNFNYPLSVNSPSSIRSVNSPSQPPAYHVSHSASGFPANIYNSPASNAMSDMNQRRISDGSVVDSPKTPTNFLLSGPNLLGAMETNNTDMQTNESSTYSTSSSGEMQLFAQRQSHNGNMELDDNNQVKAYVDFSKWYEAISQLSDEQRENLVKELMPKSVYDPIHEETIADH